jgi:hypothetical protein
MPRHDLPNGVFGRAWLLAQERGNGHQQTRRAESALQSMCVAECRLEGAQRTVSGRKTLDRLHSMAAGLCGQHDARSRRFAVEEDGAGAADTVLAPDVRTGERELAADEIAEQQARLDIALVQRAVHFHANFHAAVLRPVDINGR